MIKPILIIKAKRLLKNDEVKAFKYIIREETENSYYILILSNLYNQDDEFVFECINATNATELNIEEMQNKLIEGLKNE